ncbi:glycolate oxidase [Thermosulfidibacter takaii ABI70S6]|uniref:Glycolate oxidase n=1 Tax=Thermosulfidibacter takaii (strain DSM 17441 / JCM 13301 / NBRC 103674 / ABI70S6) TaxID=1298851 RepID=A0A0S3QVA7_THET7|nr:FAD-linked oxidase C-terminal domain-containing protein [Thermosulfidibacter takaii]BAT72263.1 glycolate oxidase [Thermosulfidibacter takaii ABI70S6]
MTAKILKIKALLEAYSYDATGMRVVPEGVCFPTSVGEVQELVKQARMEGFCLVARGGGTGFVGGAVPVKGSVVVSLEKMNRIIDVDTKNLVAVVEPGVITAELQEAVKEFGLYYPPDPSSLESCTIGGNVATNAGGPRAVKYGVTADFVSGLEAVTGTGELYSDMERVKKKVVGLNLTPVFIGSEGTLGIITRILLRLIPAPEVKITALAIFEDIEEAGKAVAEIVALPEKPSALEIMDSTSINCVKKYGSIDLPEKAEAVLLIEVDGSSEVVKKGWGRIKEVLKKYKAEVSEAKNEAEVERIWNIRRAISPSLMNIAPTKINEDITVPVSQLAEALKAFKNISQLYGIPIISFGHAGDGNIHVNIMTDKDDPKLWEKALKATQEVFIVTVGLGGVLSGEHGIGLSKKPYLGIQMPKTQIELYKRVKSAFDPDNIMNPGKKF